MGSLMRRRDDMTRITEILIRAKTGIMPTHLMSDTRLKYGPCFELVEKLLKLKFLELVPVSSSRVKYHTTEKGSIFIERVLVGYSMIGDNYLEELIKKVRAV